MFGFGKISHFFCQYYTQVFPVYLDFIVSFNYDRLKYQSRVVELYCQLLLEKISYLREVVNRGMAFIRGNKIFCIILQ